MQRPTGHEPIAWHVARWGDDPFSRGSWTALAPGGDPTHRAQLGTPIDGRVVIAGDATHPTKPSMTHGAYEEGCRAARWAVVEAHARRVVVLGAGFAGLAAARTAADLGADVVMLEARDRIGGRAHSVVLHAEGHRDVIADAGAAWLQQGPTNSLRTMAVEHDIATVPTDFARPVAGTRRPFDGDVSIAVERALAEIRRKGLAAPERAAMAELLSDHLATLEGDDRRAAQFAIDLDIDLENGVDHHLLSARTVFQEPGVGVDDRWLPGGYGQLQRMLAVGLDVRLEHVVTGFEWDHHGVRVHHQARGTTDTLTADVVVCTVPVWLLPELELRPGLPEAHRAALDMLRPGIVEKVLLRFEQRWWPVNPDGYLRWYDEPASWGEWLDLTDGVGAPVVAALIAGDAVRRHHHGRTDEQVVADAVTALERWAAAVRGG